MGVEKERNTLVMKLWVDRANLIRGIWCRGTLRQGGVLRKCNQADRFQAHRRRRRIRPLSFAPLRDRTVWLTRSEWDARMKATRSCRFQDFFMGLFVRR